MHNQHMFHQMRPSFHRTNKKKKYEKNIKYFYTIFELYCYLETNVHHTDNVHA